MFVIVLFAIISACSAGVIPQQHSYSQDHGGHGQAYGQATSYQHVKIENYHPVPVYLKKEHAHLLEHPVANGHTATNLQVHHGDKHDHGYALVSGTHQLLEHGVQGGHELEGHGGQGLGGYGGHEGQGLGGYGGHEGHGQQLVVAQQEEQQHEGAEGADLGHYDSGADLSGQGLQAYATQDVDYGHGGQEAAGYEQEAAGYEHAVEDPHQHQHYQ